MTGLWLTVLLGPLALQCAPPPAPPGQKVEDFSLRDTQGKLHHLHDLADRRLVVVAFLGADCPLAKLYAPRLEEMARLYGPRGVAFLAVNANRHESTRDLERFARQHGLSFPLLRDAGNVVADILGAERSPEVFVLDESRRVRYRGRIDDQCEVGLQRSRADRQDLRIALDELLAGKPVTLSRTEAPGCPICRDDTPAGGGEVTYCRDVAPIVQERCAVCHRPGEVGPFPLTSYAEVEGWALAIREVVQARRMPPWGANPAHGKFANDPSLTEAQRRTLLDWIEGGCPEGDRADLPPPRGYPSGWSIGEPDLVLQMPEAFTVPATGVVEYQYFVVDPGFREDRWVQQVEVRPGNKSVVHHCNIYLQPPGRHAPDELAEQGALGSYCLAAQAQGTPPLVLPAGMVKRIPAGWKVVFVMHYQTVGSEQTDRTQLGLKFADPKAVRQEVATKLMYDLNIAIPPGEAEYPVSQTWQLERDVLLLGLFPHMHLRGKSFRYEVVYPDGREEVLLDVPKWDFAWQFRYELAEPLRLPAGTRLRCTAVYDNSAANKANPDPKAWVHTGTQSWEEMFNGYFDVALADQDLTRPVPWPERAWQGARWLGRPGVALLACVVGGLFLGRRRVGRWLGSGLG